MLPNSPRAKVLRLLPGIPVSLRSTLFEPFTTLGKAGGTGLGLAIVRQIVEAHGGRVDCTSSEAGHAFFPSLTAAPARAGNAGSCGRRNTFFGLKLG